MAVVQLRNGIYVNSIETVPDADQTAAYKYASLFTKHRKENWSMAQKQAASEIADAKERDAALLKVYGQQLKDYNDRLQQLDKDIADAGTDVAKANAATQRTALQEATAAAKQKQDWALAQAEQVSVSGGGRSGSSSSGSSTGTSGGGAGSKVKGLDKTGKDSGEAIRLKMSDAPVGTANKIGAVEQDLVKATGTLDMSTEMSAIGNHATAVGQLVDERKSVYINQGYSDDDALDQAETDILNDLDNSPYKQYGTDYLAAQEIRNEEGGGGGTSSSTRQSSSYSVRDPSTLQYRYKGLSDVMPTADAVTAESVPQVPLNTTDLQKARDALATQLADLLDRGAPASTVDDFITRSREIMAGRFGSPQVSPNFYQRNAASAPISALDQAYAKYKGLAPSFMQGASTAVPTAAVPTTAGTPGKLVYDTSYGDTGGFSEAEPLGSLKTSPAGVRTSPVIPGATPTAAPIVTSGSAPAVSPGASGEAPVTAASSAAEAAAAGGASPTAVGAAAGAAAAAVPTGADVVRAVENKRLGNYPVRQKELDALFPEGVPQEVLDAAAGIKNSTPGSVERPQMQAPAGTVDTSSMPTRNSVYFPTTATNIGRKPEAVGDFSVPDMSPETETSAPGMKDYVPTPAYMPPKQPGGTFKNEFKGYVEPSEEEKKQIQDILQKKREKRETPTGKTGYFQQRFDSAKQIIDQPGKLARLIASGPGKVAADVYNANKASGKDFKLTYDTLTATYEDDKEALATAHQVALALDIAARNKTAPPKA